MMTQNFRAKKKKTLKYGGFENTFFDNKVALP